MEKGFRGKAFSTQLHIKKKHSQPDKNNESAGGVPFIKKSRKEVDHLHCTQIYHASRSHFPRYTNEVGAF